MGRFKTDTQELLCVNIYTKEEKLFEEIKEAMDYCGVTTYAEFKRALETGNDINGWVFDWV